MNPVDHVRFLFNLEAAGDPLTNCLSAPRWWKSPTYRKSFNDITVRCTRSKGRSHCGSENWSAAWYSKDQGLAVKSGCFGKIMAWICFFICDSFFDSYTAPGRGGVKSLFEPIDLTLTIEISHQRIDSFMRTLIPRIYLSNFKASPQLVLAVLVSLQSFQNGYLSQLFKKMLSRCMTFRSPLTAVRFYVRTYLYIQY